MDSVIYYGYVVEYQTNTMSQELFTDSIGHEPINNVESNIDDIANTDTYEIIKEHEHSTHDGIFSFYFRGSEIYSDAGSIINKIKTHNLQKHFMMGQLNEQAWMALSERLFERLDSETCVVETFYTTYVGSQQILAFIDQIIAGRINLLTQ